MSYEIAEFDWKLFRQLHAIALERFYNHAVSELEDLVSDKRKTSRDRFWKIHESLNENRKELASLFDGLRRSTALIQLAAIYSRDLLTTEEMSRFSPNARAFVQRYLDIEIDAAKPK